MATIVVTKLKTTDFDTWKKHYDNGESMRREHKVRGVTVTRDNTDSTIITILTRFDSAADAHAMMESPRWREMSKQNSAGGPPEMAIVEVVDEKTY